MNKIIEEIFNDEKLNDIMDSIYDMYFDSDENLEMALEELMEGGISEYEMKPFATDGTGGIYVILNNKYVGYISTEGEAGIIADSVEGYFKICFGSGCYWYDCFAEDTFESYESFNKRVKSLSEDYMSEELEREDFEYLSRFIEKYNLGADLQTVYEIFKKGIITQPEFIIKPTTDEYEESDDFFGSGHEYISTLLEN